MLYRKLWSCLTSAMPATRRHHARLSRQTSTPRLEILEDRLAPAAGPRVTNQSPTIANPGTVATAQVGVLFDQVMNVSSFTAADVISFTGPGGPVTVTGVSPISGGGNQSFNISFTPQGLAGDYTFTIGPDIRDNSNRPMDQNNNNTAGEDPADRYTGTFRILGPMFNNRNAQNSGGPPGTINQLLISFQPSTPGINGSTFDPSDFLTFTDPTGAPITITSIVPNPNRPNFEFFVNFAPQSKAGTYNFTIGPNIADPFGNLIDQNRNGVGGEVADSWSNTFTIEPFRASTSITTPGTPAGPVSQVRVTFTPRSVDLATIDPSDFTLTGPNGPISITSVTPVAGSNNQQFNVNFAPQTTLGTYTIVMGPNVADIYGNGMDQNQNGIPYENPGDTLTRTFAIVAPRLTSSSLGGFPRPGVSSGTISFSQAMDPSTFTPSDIVLTGPNGVIPINSVTPTSGANTSFTITFATQGTAGQYNYVIGPFINGATGNGIDQNQNGITGEIPGDQFTGTFTIVAPKISGGTLGGVKTAPFSSGTMTFDQDMDGSTFTPADFVSFIGPNGNVNVTGVTQIDARNFTVTFDPQTAEGVYTYVLGPDIRDLFGNQLDQNNNSIAGENPGDRYTGQFAINIFGPEPIFGYAARPTAFENIDLVAGAPGVITVLDNLDDGAAAIDLGTNTFNFFGQMYTGAGRLFVSTNGLITFGQGNTTNTQTSIWEPYIAARWRNWTTTGLAGEVLAKFEDTNNDGTQDRLIIEWSNVRNFVNLVQNQSVTFQAILDLNTGTNASGITLNYANTSTLDPSVDSSSFVGIKPAGNFSGSVLLQINPTNPTSPWVGTNKAMRITAPPIGGEIRGKKFNDLNRNGAQDAGEPGLANWQVFLDTNGNGTLDPGEVSQLTDANGNYAFTNLTPGNYVVQEVVQAGWGKSRPGVGSGSLSNGGFETGDFTDWSTIGGFVNIQGVYGSAPSEGAKQALLTTFNGATAAESFLGLNPGTLTTLGGVTATRVGAVKRTIFATAGSSLTFDYDFLTVETPFFTRRDSLFVSIAPASGEIIRNTIPPYFEGLNTNTGFALHSTYQTFSYVFPTTGTYTVGIGVMDGIDTAQISGMLLDNVRLLGGAYPVNVASRQVITGKDFGNFQLPVAADDSYSVNEDTALQVSAAGVLGNDTTYLPGGSLAAALVQGPAHGNLQFNADGSFTYTPFANYSGSDSFQYRANDGLDSNIATVHLTINPVADLPDLTVQDTSGNENAAIALSIASALTDTDGSETLAIRIDSVPGDAVLSAGTNLGGGSWLLTPGQLSGLTLTKQDSGAFTLVVNAIATETANNDMATRTANLNVTVNNLAPSASVNGPTSGIRGQALTFTLGATDPSPTDQAAGFTYAIDWDGNGTTDQTVSGPDGLQVTHTYTVAGSYTVRMTATDKDGGTSSSVSQGVTIAAIGLQPDPADANLTALVIGGTTAADVIQVQKNPTGPGVRVILNGTMYGPFTPTGHIIVYAQDGSDVIQVHNQITLPTLLFGGDGNDVISGGEGQNIVVAGAGVDTVNGGGVRDLIIGGLGSDVLASKGDDDLLIAGTTSHDANEVALCAIMQEWSSGNTYEQRVANLRTGGGLNGTAVLTASTVFDDNVADILNGSMGRDWFFARLTGLNSDVADKAANEFVN